MSTVFDRPNFKGSFDPAFDPLESIEFELDLDLQDLRTASFECCVRTAAAATGGEMLFDMPAETTVEDSSRVAAVRFRSRSGDRLLFVILDAAGERMRIARRRDVGDRFFGFAKAFVGVLERLQTDISRPAQGTA